MRGCHCSGRHFSFSFPLHSCRHRTTTTTSKRNIIGVHIFL